MQQNFYKIANATKIVFYSILSQTSQDMWLVSDCRDRSVGTVMGGGVIAPHTRKVRNTFCTMLHTLPWSNYGGPKGLGPLKDQVAPIKHLV